MYTIGQIEDAIISELQGSALGAVCRTIAVYHGEINDLTAKAGQLMSQLPAVYLLYAGSDFEEPANLSFDDIRTYMVVCMAKDLRGDLNLRAAIYPMLESIKSTLIGNNLGLDIEPLKPRKIEAVMVTGIISIYSFDIETSISINH